MRLNNSNTLRRQMMNRDDQRIWKVSEDEAHLLRQFLNICNSKLTTNEMSDLRQDEITKILLGIKNGLVTLDKIKELNAEELYDLIIGQLRLF